MPRSDANMPRRDAKERRYAAARLSQTLAAGGRFKGELAREKESPQRIGRVKTECGVQQPRASRLIAVHEPSGSEAAIFCG